MWTARFGLAIALERSGMFAAATDELRRILSEGEARLEPLNYLGYMLAEQGIQIDEAEGLIRQALQEEPRNGAYLDSLGWVQYRQGRYEEALQNLELARELLLEQGEEDPVVQEHLGDVQFKLGQVDKATKEWQAAQRLDPKNERTRPNWRVGVFIPEDQGVNEMKSHGSSWQPLGRT